MDMAGDRAIWLSAILIAIGIMLVVAALAMALTNTVQAIRPASWGTRWAEETYVSFAWLELGRALFFGYLLALGLSPLTALIFIDRASFWSNFFFGYALIWGASAIVFYFAIVLAGFVGYALHRGTSGQVGTLSLYGQVFIVTIMSAPLAVLLWAALLPPVREVVALLIETWRLYTRVFT